MANTEMINTHAAMAIAVIAVVAGVMRPNPLLPFPSFDPLSLLLIPNRLSSPPPPNCCCSIPLAMRRLPAGDAFMHPPKKMIRKGNEKKTINMRAIEREIESRKEMKTTSEKRSCYKRQRQIVCKLHRHRKQCSHGDAMQHSYCCEFCPLQQGRRCSNGIAFRWPLS